MRLTLEWSDVRAVAATGTRGLADRRLHLDLEELRELVLTDRRLERVRLELVHPGESCRIGRVFDVIAPRAKVEGGEDFPGVVGPLVRAGRGRTRALAGAAVVVTDQELENPGPLSVVDMSGPAAALTEFARTECYNAAVRLADVERAFGVRIDVRWRAFPLIADTRPGRRSTAQTSAGRARAAADESRALFIPPPEGTDFPASSVPALTAAKAAQRQGRQAFAAFHAGLFAAHFRDHLDIGRAEVLWALAQRVGLDMARFERDSVGSAHEAVLHDYAAAVAWFGISALPTVVFNERLSLVGAVPAEQYGLLIEWILAGEPGGVVPLDFSEPATGVAGQSAVGEPGPG